MMDREKVIKGLECCNEFVTCKANCPYRNDGCREILSRDAIALLKAQEPRVMTLDEFQVSEDNPKWLETKDGKHARWTLGNAGYNKFYDNHMIGYLPVERYGVDWRCWTSEPTEEQREVTPWND